MTTEKKLSKTMLDCIESMKRCGLLVRWKGGYWTRENCPKKIVDEVEVPEWWYSGSTVEALIKRGIFQVTEENYNGYDLKYYPVAVIMKKQNT